MKVLFRVGREYVAQVVAFAATLADRILLSGLLLRMWGVDGFAAWSVALAAAGLIGMFDFGIALSFSNRLAMAVARRERPLSQHVHRAGNALACAGALVGLVCIGGWFALFPGATGNIPFTGSLWLTMFCLSLVAATRMMTSIQIAVYRAHQQYTRQTMLTAAIDTTRVVVSAAIAMLGGGLVEVAGAQFATALLGTLLWTASSGRRFPDYGFSLRTRGLDRAERNSLLITSVGNWSQSLPNTLLTLLPLLLITASGSPVAAVAQFTLMRTIGNFVRSGLQLFGVVLGIESARRLAIDDMAGLRNAFREASIFISSQTGAAAGLLAALAEPLFSVWTGNPHLYSPVMLWLAIGPPLLMPSQGVAANFLAAANRPWPIVAGRAAQLALTICLYFALPVEDIALRLMAALAIGELLGLGIPVSKAVHRITGTNGIDFLLTLASRGGGCAVAVYLITRIVVDSLPATGLMYLIFELATGGVAASAVILAFGVSSQRRTALYGAVRARVSTAP